MPKGSDVAIVVLLSVAVALGQSKPSGVPHLIRYSGTLRNLDGTPRSGTVGISFSIYADDRGTVPLWQEVQNVVVDETGHYSVLLGAARSEGLPLGVFRNNDARWLGIRVENEREQARSLLVAVPYAIKAADAEMLGGKPLSAFVLNGAQNTETSNSGGTGDRRSGSGSENPASIVRPPYVPGGNLNVQSAVISGGTGEYSLRVMSGNTWIGPDRLSLSPEGQLAAAPNGLVQYTVASQMPAVAGTAINQRVADFGAGGAWGDETIFGNYDVAALTLTANPPNGQLMANAHQAMVNLNGHSLGILNANDGWLEIDGTGGTVTNAAVDFHASSPTISPGNNVALWSGFFAEPSRAAKKNVGFYTDGLYSPGTQSNVWASYLQGRNWFGVSPLDFTSQASFALYRDDAVHSSMVGLGGVTGTPGIQIAADVPPAAGFGAGQAGVYTATTFALNGDAANGQLASNFTRMSVNPAGHHMNRLAAQNAYVEAAAPGATASGTVDWVALYDTKPTSIGNTRVTNQADFYATRNVNASTNYGFYAEDFGNGYAFYGTGGKSYFGGKVGIGKTSPADQLEVAGEVRVNSCVKNASGSAIAGICSSDLRLKKNILPFSRMLDKIAKLQPVTFDWRADEFPEYHFGTERSYGLVAQDVAKVLPQMVGKDEHGMSAVNYSVLPLVTLQAVRELKEENDSLKRTMRKLEAEVHSLRRLSSATPAARRKMRTGRRTDLLGVRHRGSRSHREARQLAVQKAIPWDRLENRTR